MGSKGHSRTSDQGVPSVTVTLEKWCEKKDTREVKVLRISYNSVIQMPAWLYIRMIKIQYYYDNNTGNFFKKTILLPAEVPLFFLEVL